MTETITGTVIETIAETPAGPASLLESHLTQLHESAIDDRVAAERGYVSVGRPEDGDDTPREMLRRLGIPAWARNDDARFPGLLIPLYRVTGELISWQYKPDRPPADPQTGKARKYACQAGHSSVLDVHPRNKTLIADPSVPLFITEGVKKADALTSRGLCAVALMGVYNWRSTLGTLGDWEDVPIRDRRTVVCFDGDARQNPNVARAMARLGAWLKSKGAAEVIYLIPPAVNGGDPPKGVDDFFAAGGTLETLTAGMAPAPPPVAKDPAADPDGLLVEELAEDVLDGTYLWCPELGTGRNVTGWLRYIPGEGRWAAVTDATIAEDIRLWVKDRYEGALTVLRDSSRSGTDADRLKRLEAIAGQWRGRLARRTIADLAVLARGLLIRDADDFDAHPDLLNCPNGVADLRTGKLLDHDPDLCFTQVTRARYAPGKTHPDWDKALEAIPAGLRDYVALRYGQSVTGHIPPDDVVLVQLGKGSNGKTTIVYAVQGALGGFFRTISERAVIADRSQHPTELMDFRGARLAVLEELPEDRMLNMRRIKAITAPEITARYCGQDSAAYSTSHAFVISANHDPGVPETDNGSWRRLMALRFPYRYYEPHKMPASPGPMDRVAESGLRERLRSGEDGRGEAVLAWLVGNAAQWYAGDGGKRAPMAFGPAPAVIRDDTDQWRAQANPMFSYVAEVMAGDPGSHVMTSDLTQVFTEYLKVSGHPPWSATLIATRFLDCCDALGHKVRKVFVDAANSRTETVGTLSRPASQYPAPAPAHYKAWQGIRFRTMGEQAAEEGPENPDQGGDQGFIGFIGSPVSTQVEGSTGRLAEDPIKPIKDLEPHPADLPAPFVADPPGPAAVRSAAPVPGLSLGFDLETADAGKLFTYRNHDDRGYVRLAGMIGPAGSPVITSGAALLPVLEAAGEVCGHNILGFDGLALAWHHGMDWESFAARARDTELIARQAWPPRSKETHSEDKLGLDAVAEILGIPGKTDDLRRLARQHGGYDQIPLDDPEYLAYLEGDLRATAAVSARLCEYYDTDPYLPREHKLASLAGRMSLNGFAVDQDLLARRLAEGEERKRQALQVLHEGWGLPLGKTVSRGRGKAKHEVFEEAVSPLSTDFGRDWLAGQWERYQVPDPPRTDTGKLALGAEELKRIAGDPSCPPDLRAMLAMMGIVTTTRTVYQTAQSCLAADGRVHPSISMRQSSGRWSTTNPGLTVFGKHGGRHVERDVFVPDEGHVLFSCDLSQVDMRGIAGHCQDPAYMEMFAPGQDAHEQIAAQVGLTRQQAKAIGHGWNYGLGAPKMIESGMDPDVVYRFTSGMEARFPRLMSWREEIRARARAGEILDNGFGRRMSADPARAYTVAPALMGQGTAGDIMKEVLIRLDERAPGLRPYYRVMVHDEQVFSVPKEDVEDAIMTVKEAFTWEWRGVPILCDINGPGDSWGAISAK